MASSSSSWVEEKFPREYIQNYKLIKKLGEGGYGEVFLVEDENEKKKYALKILKVFDFSDESTSLREIDNLKKSNSPFIIEYIDHFKEKHRHCILTKYYEVCFHLY